MVLKQRSIRWKKTWVGGDYIHTHNKKSNLYPPEHFYSESRVFAPHVDIKPSPTKRFVSIFTNVRLSCEHNRRKHDKKKHSYYMDLVLLYIFKKTYIATIKAFFFPFFPQLYLIGGCMWRRVFLLCVDERLLHYIPGPEGYDKSS